MEATLPQMVTCDKYHKLKSVMCASTARIDSTIVQLKDVVTEQELNQEVDHEFQEELSKLLLIYSRMIGEERFSSVVYRYIILPDPQSVDYLEIPVTQKFTQNIQA